LILFLFINFVKKKTLVCLNRFIRKALGGPTIVEYEKLKQEKEELQTKCDVLLKQHIEACEEVY